MRRWRFLVNHVDTAPSLQPWCRRDHDPIYMDKKFEYRIIVWWCVSRMLFACNQINYSITKFESCSLNMHFISTTHSCISHKMSWGTVSIISFEHWNSIPHQHHTHTHARARTHILQTSRHLVLSSLFSTVVQNFPTRSKQSMWIWTWNSGHGFGLGQWHRLWISECTLLFHERNENLQSVEGRLFLSTALHNLWSWWVTNHSYNYSIFTLTREIRKGLGDRNLSTLIRIVK